MERKIGFRIIYTPWKRESSAKIFQQSSSGKAADFDKIESSGAEFSEKLLTENNSGKEHQRGFDSKVSFYFIHQGENTNSSVLLLLHGMRKNKNSRLDPVWDFFLMYIKKKDSLTSPASAVDMPDAYSMGKAKKSSLANLWI